MHDNWRKIGLIAFNFCGQIAFEYLAVEFFTQMDLPIKGLAGFNGENFPERDFLFYWIAKKHIKVLC